MKTAHTHPATAQRLCGRSVRRGGFSVLYLSFAMVLVFAFASLALDYGRVQAAKTELRRAADAAARAAITRAGSISGVQDAAYLWASKNTCDGSAVLINKGLDVEFWAWDPGTRKLVGPLSGTARAGADAIKVTCRRTLPLTLGQIVGARSCDVKGSTTAAIIPPGFGLVGINYIKLSGNSTASYWSGDGYIGANQGHIASNGNVTSTSTAIINGSVWTLPGATVTGVSPLARRTLTAPLSYANGSSSPYSRTNNDNARLPSGLMNNWNLSTGNSVYTIQPGNYIINSFSVGANGGLLLQGPTTFYCYGNVNLGGNATTAKNLPHNLKIVMIPNPISGVAPGTVSVSSGASLHAHIYAPQSDVTLSGNGAIYGQVIGKSITMTGSSDVYYDLSGAGGSDSVQILN